MYIRWLRIFNERICDRINYTYEIMWRHAGRWGKVYVQRKGHFDIGERTNAMSCATNTAGKDSRRSVSITTTVLYKVSNLVPNSHNWVPVS